jgi:hypothetical protein
VPLLALRRDPENAASPPTLIRVVDHKIVIERSYSLMCLVMSTVAARLQQLPVDCDPARLWHRRGTDKLRARNATAKATPHLSTPAV